MFIRINGDDKRRIKHVSSAAIPGVVTIITDDDQTLSIELAVQREDMREQMLVAALVAAINNRNAYTGQ